MTKKQLREQFSTDFKKVNGALMEIIQTSREVSSKIAEVLVNNDYSSIEEYNMLTNNIINASKQFNDLYTQAPKIIGSIEKEIKDQKQKVSLDELMNKNE